MRFFKKKSSHKAVRKEDALQHLSQKFNIPTEDLTYDFKRSVMGWRNGKPESADTLTITIKQPVDRPNLHHDMHQELKDVFSAYYGAGAFNPKAMKFYFGVIENKEYTAAQNAKRPKIESVKMAPELN